MNKQTTTIAIASVFAVTSLFAYANPLLAEDNLNISEFNEVAHTLYGGDSYDRDPLIDDGKR